MKKFKIVACIVVLCSLFFAVTAYAGTTYLFWHSNYTYVSSTHNDLVTYYGIASVRGADRVIVNNRNSYFVWTRITYDVQGSVSSKTAYSGGKNNTSQVVETLVVNDSWSGGDVTRAYYNYGTSYVDGSVGLTSSNDTIIFGGEAVPVN